MRLIFVLPCVALTFLCWGNYGPLMHEGQHGMGDSRMRPFICVGLAYFIVAVIVPILVLKTKGESGNWTVGGFVWSIIAGSAGALGALGIILAFSFNGNPVYVMPLVFGCAPVVNTLVTMSMTKSFKEASPVFLAGILIVAIGAAGVLYLKPSGKKKAADATEEKHVDHDKEAKEKGAKETTGGESAPNYPMILASIALTALTWGSYGPLLHKGQMKMAGSRLRPLLCVGLAYFAIAVIVPSLYLNVIGEKGVWDWTGGLWSLGAGAAGAIGALGIIMAFNFGGKPIFVMPLVFGCAPVINTFTTIISKGTMSQISPSFMGALGMVILGAVMVLVFAPKPKPKGAKPEPPKVEEKSDE